MNIMKTEPRIILYKELKLQFFINYVAGIKAMKLMIWNSHLKLSDSRIDTVVKQESINEWVIMIQSIKLLDVNFRKTHSMLNRLNILYWKKIYWCFKITCNKIWTAGSLLWLSLQEMIIFYWDNYRLIYFLFPFAHILMSLNT